MNNLIRQPCHRIPRSSLVPTRLMRGGRTQSLGMSQHELNSFMQKSSLYWIRDYDWIGCGIRNHAANHWMHFRSTYRLRTVIKAELHCRSIVCSFGVCVYPFTAKMHHTSLKNVLMFVKSGRIETRAAYTYFVLCESIGQKTSPRK